jgi:hypothetical protein
VIDGTEIPVTNLQQILANAGQTREDGAEQERADKHRLQGFIKAQMQSDGRKALGMYVTYSDVKKVEELARMLNLVQGQGGPDQWREAVTCEYRNLMAWTKGKKLFVLRAMDRCFPYTREWYDQDGWR